MAQLYKLLHNLVCADQSGMMAYSGGIENVIFRNELYRELYRKEGIS